MDTQSNLLSQFALLLGCLFVPGFVVAGIVYWVSLSRKRAMGTAQRLGFEAASCTRTPEGNILVAPSHGTGALITILGLSIAALNLWWLAADPPDLSSLPGSLVALPIAALGGLLTYLGSRAFTSATIAIEPGRRVIEMLRGGQVVNAWAFDDVAEVTEWPPGITESAWTALGFPLVRVDLHFADGVSQNLLTTSNVQRTKTVLDWLAAAFRESDSEGKRKANE